MDLNDTNCERVSERVFKFINELLNEGFNHQIICVALVSHAARLGLQNENEPVQVVGNLVLPLVHQLMDKTNFDSDFKDELNELDELATHRCKILQ